MSDIIQQQIEYYRARAAEYDEWWYRQGRYDRGADLNKTWFEESQQVRDALHALPQCDHVLELASGTGIWTQELIKIGKQVTALDASAEVIAINQAKLQSDKVTYIQADLFEWEADKQYDMIFFSFWLSHVPPEKLKPFLDKVSTMLKPDGHLFMLDSRRIPESTAVNHHIPDEGTTMERKLNDGRTFQIVKIFYEPQNLESTFLASGIQAKAHVTNNFFIYAHGQK